ncbi:hypothetical protein E2C01_046380 [Portunus trituberculatus]|uniref:Uncharacterized protein n=1 Tax=Portunus trituberculatus TaxID=210409 RepID=A0A5B7G4L2_PORTR|nr:hypothetical protein [Portunus trituberculatus]
MEDSRKMPIVIFEIPQRQHKTRQDGTRQDKTHLSTRDSWEGIGVVVEVGFDRGDDECRFNATQVVDTEVSRASRW